MVWRSKTARYRAWPSTWYRPRSAALLLSLFVALVPLGQVRAANTTAPSWTRYRGASTNNALVPQAGQAVSWRSPVIQQDELFDVSVVGNRVYAVGSGVRHGVYAFDRQTGRLLWGTVVDNLVMSEPIVVGTRLFIGTGNNTFF